MCNIGRRYGQEALACKRQGAAQAVCRHIRHRKHFTSAHIRTFCAFHRAGSYLCFYVCRLYRHSGAPASRPSAPPHPGRTRKARNRARRCLGKQPHNIQGARRKGCSVAGRPIHPAQRRFREQRSPRARFRGKQRRVRGHGSAPHGAGHRIRLYPNGTPARRARTGAGKVVHRKAR